MGLEIPGIDPQRFTRKYATSATTASGNETAANRNVDAEAVCAVCGSPITIANMKSAEAIRCHLPGNVAMELCSGGSLKER